MADRKSHMVPVKTDDMLVLVSDQSLTDDQRHDLSGMIEDTLKVSTVIISNRK